MDACSAKRERIRLLEAAFAHYNHDLGRHLLAKGLGSTVPCAQFSSGIGVCIHAGAVGVSSPPVGNVFSGSKKWNGIT